MELTQQEIDEMDALTGLSQKNPQESAINSRLERLKGLKQKQPGLRGAFYEQMGDIKDTVKGVGESFKKGSQRVTESINRYSEGKQRLSDTVLQSVGAGASAVSGAAGELLTGGLKLTAPQFVEDIAEKGIQAAVKPLTKSQKVKDLIQRYEQLKIDDPTTAANIEGALGIGELALDFVGGKAGKKAVDKSIDVVEGAVKLGKKGSDLAKDSAQFLVGKTSGLDPATIEYVFKNPQDYKKAVESGITRAGVADDFFNTVESKLSDVAETGARYEPIRKSGTVVDNIDPDFFDKFFVREGFDVKNGVIKPTTRSATRDSGEIAKLQEFYDTWNPAVRKESMDAEEILNFRKDAGDLSKFDRASGKVPVSEKLSKGLYDNINNQISSKVPGLRQLDEEFAPARKELDAIKKEFLSKDTSGNWQLKDTAINKIANATGKGKDNVAERLEAYMPGITEKVRVAKVLEDIEYAKGRNVGAYLQGGSVYAGLATGNIPLAIGGLVVSSPTILTKVLSNAGIAAQKISSITGKIKSGIKMTVEENKVLKDALDLINKDNISTIIGVPAGVGAVDELFNDSEADGGDQ
jgi:hypothetical protein